MLKQFHKIIGAVDFLGNPAAVASQLGTGLKSFFYDPATALLSSPQDAAKAFATGAASLLQNTTTAVFTSSSKVAGTLAKGLARFTDESFMKVTCCGMGFLCLHKQALVSSTN